MQIPFQTIDWSQIEKIAYAGEAGFAWWQTLEFGGLRIRMVEYSIGYIANHWCKKGHIVQCLEGSIVSELEDGNSYVLTKGMTYVVSDDMSSHKSYALHGAKLMIIDGDFLAGQ